MPSILVLEGLTDAKFFQELLGRLYLKDAERVFDERPGRRNMPTGIRGTTASGAELEIEFRYYRESGESAEGGKGQFPVIIRGLLDQEIWNFTVAQDLDGDSRAQVSQSIRDVVYAHIGVSSHGDQEASGPIALGDGTITVVPIGLANDGELNRLGISKHSLEDYVIKLILEDPSLRSNVSELRPLLLEILPPIRNTDGDFDSSKDIFQLIKPMVQHGFSDTGVVEKVVRDADEAILRSVLAPLLVDVERAFGL